MVGDSGGGVWGHGNMADGVRRHVDRGGGVRKVFN